MKLSDIYDACIAIGIEHDVRDEAEIDRALSHTRRDFNALGEAEKQFFDLEKLTNPYADTRICTGDPEASISGLLVGIDMEVGEVLLADRLRERGSTIDLVFAHHPEGSGYASLHEVMYMQADMWASQGVSIGAGDALIAPRAEEIRRRVAPMNHYRPIDAARLLGFSFLSCHTPADNCVTCFVQNFLDAENPDTLEALTKALRTIPEYADGARKGYGPTIVTGAKHARPGRILVDMTGGTEGPHDALDRLSQAGVGTLVGMHYSEEHRKRAEELKLNLVVAGHVSSDVLGMNLVLDRIEALGELEVHCVSGMVRFTRS
jgi:hypothetical protein